VVGLGAMGSASAYHLSGAGCRVLGLDRFKPPHNLGSSHGLTRIIREAYFEHPSYVPLVQRSYQLWEELERKSGRQLLLPTGGLMIGPLNGPLIAGARRSASKHHLPHQLLTGAQLRKRFPAFCPAPDMVAVSEPRAGILFPELAVKTHLKLAANQGAILRFGDEALHWRVGRKGVEVTTATGIHRGDWLIISAGPWAGSLLSGLGLPLIVERQVLAWFQPKSHPELFKPDRFPIFICQYAPRAFFYGFPDLGDGCKVALHHEGQITSPDAPRHEPEAADIAPLRELLRRFIPWGNGPVKSSTACLYTNAPDEHFVFGRHPRFPQVIIVSPCSGHGFKFSPVIGEIVRQFVTGEQTSFDLSLFRPDRFARGRSRAASHPSTSGDA
jgi:sarcosine oxidase